MNTGTVEINHKIEEALKDSDIVNIMNKASGSFCSQLDKDEIYTCQLNALWKALCNHDEKKAAKFTTYLYNGVRIECIREVKFKSKAHQHSYSDVEENRNHFFSAELLDEIDKCPNSELLVDRMKNFTIKEIADRHGCNRETVRRKIKKSVKSLQKRLV